MAALLVMGGILIGARSRDAANQNEAIRILGSIYDILRLAYSEVRATSGAPGWFLYRAVHPGNGATRGADMDDGALVLLTGFLQGGDGKGQDFVRLIRRDGQTVARWRLKALEPGHKDTVHGIVADPEGTITFIMHEREVAQVDRCGNLSFAAPGIFHHSVIPAETGGYWALGLNELPRNSTPADYLPPHTSDFFLGMTDAELGAHGEAHIGDDTVVRLDGSGRRLMEFSIPKLLYESGLRQVMNGRPVGIADLVHANSIRELSTELAPAFPMFEAGDLLLSLREVAMVLVLDPDTRKIKWHRTGPWHLQHDAQFQPDGTITVFNNGHISWKRRGRIPLHSNILRVNPANGEVSVVMGSEISEQADFYTERKGQHQILPGGEVLVVEAERGRVVQLSPQGEVLWEYINRHNESMVGELLNAYVYPADYFQVDDWSCPEH